MNNAPMERLGAPQVQHHWRQESEGTGSRWGKHPASCSGTLAFLATSLSRADWSISSHPTQNEAQLGWGGARAFQTVEDE